MCVSVVVEILSWRVIREQMETVVFPAKDNASQCQEGDKFDVTPADNDNHDVTATIRICQND